MQIADGLCDYMSEKVSKHQEHSAAINIEEMLKSQQDFLHQKTKLMSMNQAVKMMRHLNPQYSASHRLMSNAEVQLKRLAKTKRQRNQITYTIDDNGNKIYEFTSLSNNDEETCGEVKYVHEKTDTSTIMYR